MFLFLSCSLEKGIIISLRFLSHNRYEFSDSCDLLEGGEGSYIEPEDIAIFALNNYLFSLYYFFLLNNLRFI